MSNILQKICENKSKELEETKKRCSFKTLEKLISSKLEKREFKDELISAQKNKTNFIIGEVKKQSPSAGEIISDYIPEDIAIVYGTIGGAAMGSVIQAKIGNHDGFQYIVNIDECGSDISNCQNDQDKAFVQGDNTPLSNGQKVVIIYGDVIRIIPYEG